MVGVALVTLAERKISRVDPGPARPEPCAAYGWLQPVADGLKNIMKEETYPGAANLPLFILAPAISFIAGTAHLGGDPVRAPAAVSPWGRIDMVVATCRSGYLFILAISSLGVYGIVLAGWSSNNKYALLGGLRSSAQMISLRDRDGDVDHSRAALSPGTCRWTTIVRQQAR